MKFSEPILFQAAPGRVAFQYVQGSPSPAAQTVSLLGSETYFTIASSAWISQQSSGPSPGTVKISVNPAGIAPGAYAGTVSLNPFSGTTPLTIDVALSVFSPTPVLTAAEPAVVPVGSGDTLITVRGSGFTVGMKVYIENAAWTLSPVTLADPTTVTFRVPKSYFTAETSYALAVQNAQSLMSNVISIAVGRVGPVVSQGGVRNAASYAAPPVAVGEMIVVHGTNFGTLETTKVLFDSQPATLIYVTPSQLAATVPASVANRATTSLVIQSGNVSSAPIVLSVAPSAPAIFTADASGSGQAAALNQDSSINGASSPAAQGSVIVLFGTGGGALTLDSLPRLTLPASATVAGVDAEVLFAGAAPGLPEGVMQTNLKMPAGVQPGNVKVVLTVGGAQSNVVTVASQ
jgi:uncharacterized protein (TIGR03437 family)